MIAQKQRNYGEKGGDCFRACLTSILEIPNSEELPNIDDDIWFGRWNKFLRKFGLLLEYDPKRVWRSGYWIASVPTKNLSKGITHAIVMKGHNVAFDPSLGKRYRTNRNMLGSKLIWGGFYLIAADVNKLHLLDEYRNKINGG